MELSDYDLLGVTPLASFRIVKNAYYELSRIYHPDSSQIIIGMSKEDKLVAFQKIQSAYENIKKKLNVVEVDLPETEMKYSVDNIIKKSNELSVDDEEFNEKFNKEFEKINKQENIDNPYSIHYQVPEKSQRNLNDNQLILKEFSKKSNTYEFGVNYVEDHSCENFCDIRNQENLTKNGQIKEGKIKEEQIKEGKIKEGKIKEEIDDNLDEKLEELIKSRNETFKLSEDDKEFIEKQNRIKKEIEESKNIVQNRRNIGFLN